MNKLPPMTDRHVFRMLRKKWNLIIANDGVNLEGVDWPYPLSEYDCFCSMCENQYRKSPNKCSSSDDCDGCIFNDNDIVRDCCTEVQIWSKDETSANAQKVMDRIIKEQKRLKVPN